MLSQHAVTIPQTRARFSVAHPVISALLGSAAICPWPGIYVKPNRDRDALTAMLVREGYLPVWLESGLLDAYYNGFCNRWGVCRAARTWNAWGSVRAASCCCSFARG
jgi:hypothetical protein